MKMNFRLIFSVLLLRVLVGCLLGAAGVDHAPTGAGTVEQPRFRTLGWGVRDADLYYSLKGKDVAVSVYDGGRSGFQSLPHTDSISFYHLVPNADGVVERVIVAETSLVDVGVLPLLVFLPDQTNSAHYRIVTVADDLVAFPARSCRFVNLTRVTINATVGDIAVVVPGGEERLVPTELGKDEDTRYATVFVNIRDGKLMLSRNNWVFRRGQRTLVFIFLDKLGRPQVVRVVDGIHQLGSGPGPA